eukprot:scaffold8260_cov258-Pinguiococcus_pyrenoidosus.AAC.2
MEPQRRNSGDKRAPISLEKLPKHKPRISQPPSDAQSTYRRSGDAVGQEIPQGSVDWRCVLSPTAGDASRRLRTDVTARGRIPGGLEDAEKLQTSVELRRSADSRTVLELQNFEKTNCHITWRRSLLSSAPPVLPSLQRWWAVPIEIGAPQEEKRLEIRLPCKRVFRQDGFSTEERRERQLLSALAALSIAHDMCSILGTLGNLRK